MISSEHRFPFFGIMRGTSSEGDWLAGYGNCGNGGPFCQGTENVHFCLMAAPKRASARRRSSSSMAGRLSAMRAAISGSSGGGGVGGARRRSGAWRNAMRPIACQPKKRLTRSRITADKCWISSAAGPSTRSTRRGRFRGVLVHCARPINLHRFAMGGDLRTGNIGPPADDFRGGKALRLEAVAQGRARELRKRAGKTARRLVHEGGFSCHRRRHERSSPQARAKESIFIAGPGRFAGLVRPPPPRAALAVAPRRTAGPVPGLAVGNHAAADHGENGRALLRQVSGALADGRGARRSEPRRRAARLGRARLLRARPQSACLRARRGRAPRRDISGTLEGLRALPGIGDYTAAAVAAIAFDGRRAGRRQCRARGGAGVRGRRRIAGVKARNQTSGGILAAAAPRRRFRARR